MFLRRVRVSWLRWACRRDALRRERWPSGGGLAFEFEVVSGRVADEHRVVVQSVLRPQPRLVEDLGAGCGGELVAKSDGRLVLDPERNVGLATTGVSRKGEEQLGWLARQGVPDQDRHIEGSRTPGQADDLVVPVADGVQVVDLEDDVVEQRHGRSPVLRPTTGGWPVSSWSRVRPRIRALLMTRRAVRDPATRPRLRKLGRLHLFAFRFAQNKARARTRQDAEDQTGAPSRSTYTPSERSRGAGAQ